jgi:amidase
MTERSEGTVVAPVDTVGAFVGEPAVLVAGAASGPLAGSRLAVKDLFDVAGTVTGAGNPTFAAGRTRAATTATAVARLVDAGATVIGKTITDELAYSLSGTNVHDGTPQNVNAPGRVPGGSSAGSAAAVAAGLADRALGTDTGGSIRVPASYCGIAGWRPTHGAVPMDGVVPLAPSFDTAGLLARDTPTLAAGAQTLLGSVSAGDARAVTRLALVGEVLDDAAAHVAAEVRRVAGGLGADPVPMRLGIDLGDAVAAFRAWQGWEAWQAHGAWITSTRPGLGPGIAARFAAASAVTAADADAARSHAATVRAAVLAATADGTVLVVPGAAGAAPPPGPDPVLHDALRVRTLRLTCLAGLAGAPVVVLPLGTDEGLPLGIAFIGHPGSDLDLLAYTAGLGG